MTNIPERIWRWAVPNSGGFVDYSPTRIKSPYAREYIRADVEQAAVAAAYEDAAQSLREVYPDGHLLALTVKSRTPANARAAYDKAIAEAEARGRAEALEQVAQYVSQNSLSWRFSSPWHGKDFAKELRALAQEGEE